jgi:aldose 1-epimerase
MTGGNCRYQPSKFRLSRNMHLRCGEWEAEVLPGLGGALAALRLAGVDVLRPTPADASDPLQTACFPLVPYCNRIRDGRFNWNAREVALPLNFLPQLHPLHGLGWKLPWIPFEFNESQVNLRHDYDGSDAWPWAYAAQQSVELDGRGCSISLSVTNTGHEPMPLGLGLHPYFRRRPGCVIRFDAQTVLLNDADCLPTGIEAPGDHFGAWSSGGTLPCDTIDHCHRGWGGRVEIIDDLGTITITADAAHLHMFAPLGGEELCFEPVSHTPDAINRAPGEMTVVAPGESFRIGMRIEAGHSPV